MNEYWLFPFTSLIVIGFLILVVSFTSRQRAEGRAFLALSLFFAAEMASELVLLRGADWLSPIFWLKVEASARLLSLPAFVWFIHVLVGRMNLRIRASLAILSGIGLGQLLLTLRSDAVLVEPVSQVAGEAVRAGPLFPLYVVLLLVVTSYGVYFLIWSYQKATSPFQRRALQWIALGMSLWLAGGVVPSLLMQLLNQDSPAWPNGLFSTLKLAAFTYALVIVEQKRLRHLQQKEQNKFLALSEIARVSAKAAGESNLFDQIAVIVYSIMHAKTAVLYFIPGETPWSGVVASASWKGATSFRRLLETCGLLTRTALESGQPVVINDLARSLKFVSEPTAALASCPIFIRDRAVGSIILIGKMKNADSPEHGYTADDVDLLQTIAYQVGLAVENAVLQETRVRGLRKHLRLQDLGQEEERKRISRELHDGPAQTLAAAVTLAKVAHEMVESDPHQARQILGNMAEQVKGSMEEIRRISRDLRPAMLDHLGLVPTLQWYVDNLAHEAKLQISLDVIGNPGRLSAGLEMALYRVVQEALNNSRKHAQCSSVHVELRIGSDDVEVTVSDNGRGFSPQSAGPDNHGHGLGLNTMRERVEILEGTFVVKSQPGSGTTVWARIPLARSERRTDADYARAH